MVSTSGEFDIIFAGGGTTACFIAGRLAKADPSLKILIVEAGPHTRDDLAHIQPARFQNNLVADSKVMTFHVGNPEAALGGRPAVISVGHCVGGGSSLNFMMYSRSSASDYDDWEKLGNPGWGSKDLIPLMKKTETYEVEPGQDSVHGYSGPLRVSYGGIFSNIGKEFLEFSSKYDMRSGITKDGNAFFESSIDRYARWPKWISTTGRRQDVPHALIYDKGHENITLITGYLIKRVIFENKRAVGVEYIENPRVHESASGVIQTARARRLVVVSSGTFGSPGILERSGIGGKRVLERCGVEQLVELPGVGDNYLDHQIIFAPYFASENAETIDAIVRGEEPIFSASLQQWKEDGSGLMATNGIDAALKIRPNPEERAAIGSEFETRWQAVFANAPDKPIAVILPLSMFVGDIASSPSRKYFSIAWFLSHPSARGFIHIKDGNDPTVLPEYETGFLTPDDMALMVWLYKRTREYARRMPSFRGEYAPSHPGFAENSAALCKGEISPVAPDAPDIHYTEEDDEAIREFMRKNGCWHSLGTCAMKPREKGGVVDSRLNVYGVEGLKVADLSICPSNVSANTYSTATVIAEKAAIFIGEELGINGV